MSTSIDAVLASRPKSPSGASSSSSASDVLDLRADEGWEDVQPEEEEDAQAVCLLNDGTFRTVRALLAHCSETHGFDLLAVRRELGLDIYGTIKLVNYLRSEVRAGRSLPRPSSRAEFDDEKYLHPVLEDDALLFGLDDVEEVRSEDKRVAELEDELARARSQFAEYQLAVKRTLDERLDARLDEQAEGDVERQPALRDDDSHYFTSYAYNDIHEIMLKDRLRTDSYRDFIYAHKPLFAGKTVLDVGCGTGILSLFCARAGAARVLAVDNSAIILKCRQNVFENGLDGTISCIRGKIEEVVLPVARVDVIVSEWMGYCLLYEAMLDSVLWARDNYLDPRGLMVPSDLTLRIAPLCEPDYVADHVQYWTEVYGFRMSAMQEGIYEDVIIRDVPESAVATRQPATFRKLPLYEVGTADLTFTAPFETVVDTGELESVLDGWVIWFDTFFLPGREGVEEGARAETWADDDERKGVAFSTGPVGKMGREGTHWRQGCLLVDHQKSRGKGKGEPQMVKTGDVIKGTVGYKKREDNEREVDIEVTWEVVRKGEDMGERAKQTWFMR